VFKSLTSSTEHVSWRQQFGWTRLLFYLPAIGVCPWHWAVQNSNANFVLKEKCVAIYRVVFHDQGEPWYGLHEVEFDDAGQVAWWNKEVAGFKCDASEGQIGVAQSLVAAAGDAERWPALKSSELPK
jgi:hypothetical protein